MWLGYRFSDFVRADLRYSRLEGGLDWRGDFPAGPSTDFKADRVSNMLMANVFFHGKGVHPEVFSVINPFIGVGLGMTYNYLYNVKESQNGNPVADVDSATTLSPACRIGIGTDMDISPNLLLTWALDGYWLGEFKTGNSRSVGPIGAWGSNDTIAIGTTLGQRYMF